MQAQLTGLSLRRLRRWSSRAIVPAFTIFATTFATALVSRWSRQANPIPQRLVLLSRYLMVR